MVTEQPLLYTGNPYHEGKLLYLIDPARDQWYLAYNLQPVSSDATAQTDATEPLYSYQWHIFDHRPTHSEVCDFLYGAINDACDEAILTGGSYTTLEDEPRTCRLWLNQQNQFNWKALYDMAGRSSGANLPAILKLGISDEDAYYYRITTMRQLEHFILSVFKYISSTLATCWDAKQRLDLSPYTIDTPTDYATEEE